MTKLVGCLFLLTLLAGCSSVAPELQEQPDLLATIADRVVDAVAGDVVLPVDGNIVGYNATYKRFGEYFQDRFTGYHVGEDIEVPQEDLGEGEVQEVPVLSIADGTVSFLETIGGYGGVMRVQHDIDNEIITAIYGHIDVGSVEIAVGDRVEKGQFLANLGDHHSRETDGERQHLHFALYEGTDARLAGYERRVTAVDNWINPYQFFIDQGIGFKIGGWKSYSTVIEPSGRSDFPLDFELPAHWDVEYIPQIQSLSLFDARGEGTARERSQVLIRFFDARDFLTLDTVEIFSTEDVEVGGDSYGGTKETYAARRYDIEKKPGVREFPFQPSWRNERHIVTDFRGEDRFTRYFVVAANPELDEEVYERVLSSMRILH